MSSFSKAIQSLCVATTLLVPLTAKSDIYVLKDGTRLKGKIMKQTYEFYTLKVEIAENILGEKKVRVKDVVQIIKDDLSVKDFQRIKSLFPTGDFLSEADYDTIKKNYFLKFYSTHPKSKHTKEVKELQKALDKEYENLKNGGVKIDGDLLSKDQIDANKYEVSAIILLRQLEHQIETKKYLSAMRSFETLEKGFKHTRPFPKAVNAVQKILPKFIRKITEISAAAEDEVKKKQRHIERLAPGNKVRITELLKKEEAEYQASLLNAKEVLKTKWLPLNKYEKEPVDLVIKHALSEQQRIEKLSKIKYEDGGKLYRSILSAIDSKDPSEGAKLLSDFQRLSPPQSYLNDLKIAILETKNAAEARKERERQAAIEKAKADAAAKKAEKEAKKDTGKSTKSKDKTTK